MHYNYSSLCSFMCVCVLGDKDRNVCERYQEALHRWGSHYLGKDPHKRLEETPGYLTWFMIYIPAWFTTVVVCAIKTFVPWLICWFDPFKHSKQTPDILTRRNRQKWRTVWTPAKQLYLQAARPLRHTAGQYAPPQVTWYFTQKQRPGEIKDGSVDIQQNDGMFTMQDMMYHTRQLYVMRIWKIAHPQMQQQLCQKEERNRKMQ